MKYLKYMLFILPVLLSTGSVYSQWLQQTSGINTTFRDIEFLNKNTGWIVGDAAILKTTNGGNNWILQQNPVPDYPIFNIHVVDSNIAYIAGWFDLVLKTTNGGTNWNVMRAAPWGQGLCNNEALFFINETTGWIAGQGDDYLKTTDGGLNFSVYMVNNYHIHDMYFKDANTGLMTGGALNNYKTTDAGETWRFVQMPVGSFGPEFHKLSVVNDSLAWVIAEGSAQVFKTTDFGDSWICTDTINVSGSATDMVALMYSICFIDENTGFAGGEQGKLYKSTDGGFNWTRQNSGYFPPAFIGAIELMSIPDNPLNPTGWATGGAGKIIKTTNGGQNYVGIENNVSNIPTKYELSQNYPNPFNPITTINYQIPSNAFVSIKIYDLSGKEVRTLRNELHGIGNYSVQFDASTLSSGIYFYKIQANEFMQTKKMLLIK